MTTPASNQPPMSSRSSRPASGVALRGADLREHPRQDVELDAGLGAAHHIYSGLVENLSESGAFVATHLLRPVGEVVELSVYETDGGVLLSGLGEVRWIRSHDERSGLPPGMGLKFLELDPGAEAAFASLLSAD